MSIEVGIWRLGDIVERVNPVFFSDPMTAAMKALEMT